MLRVPNNRLRKLRLDWFSHQKEVNVKYRLVRFLFLLVFIIALCTVAMMVFESLSFEDALWLSLTTITTIGYGDVSPQTTLGRLSIVILVYFVGIAVLAQIIGDYIDYRIDKRSRMLLGKWRWRKMKNHILIINTPERDSNRYLDRLLAQLRKTPEFSELDIQLLTEQYPEGLPNQIAEHKVVHYDAVPENRNSLYECNISSAKYIIILSSNFSDQRSDSVSFDILDNIKRIGTKAHILAECIDDDNRERFYEAGAITIIRPIRAYPELLVRTLVAPGSEALFENLFTHEDVHLRRYEIELDEVRWESVCLAIIKDNLGTLLGYIDNEGNLITNPSSMAQVTVSALLIMVRHDNIPTELTVRNTTDALQSVVVDEAD